MGEKFEIPEVTAITYNQMDMFIDCPFCGERHEHDLKISDRIAPCKQGNMYRISGKNIIYVKTYEKRTYSPQEKNIAYPITATIYNEYVRFECPFCYHPHCFDTVPTEIFMTDCGKGFVEITEVIDKTHLSNQKPILNRLDSI